MAACGPIATASPAPVTVEPPITGTQPVEANTPQPEKQTLTVLAAASLTESFSEISKAFENLHPGVTVTFSFAGSQQLAQQLDQGAPADVFASANIKYMQQVVDSRRVAADSPVVFARNRLVVIHPLNNPGSIQSLQDLSKPGLKIVLANSSVPVGNYTLTFLENASKDAAFSSDYKDSVLANVVSYEENVKSVATKVALGEADAGIVYSTDVTADLRAQVDAIDIPDALNVTATYPIAVIADSSAPVLAQAFVEYVLSAEGQAVLAQYGFLPPQ